MTGAERTEREYDEYREQQQREWWDEHNSHYHGGAECDGSCNDGP